VTCTTLSATVIVPLRGAELSFAATVNRTGLSPLCGMEVVIEIQDALACAVHKHLSCNAPPQT
jgi:hypothetical protein